MATPVEPFYEELGAQIREVREHRGISQAILGRSLKPPMTRASIANIENAKQRVLVHTLQDIARVLRVGLDDLMPRAAKGSGSRASAAAIEKELAAEIGHEHAAVLSAEIAAARRRAG